MPQVVRSSEYLTLVLALWWKRRTRKTMIGRRMRGWTDRYVDTDDRSPWLADVTDTGADRCVRLTYSVRI